MRGGEGLPPRFVLRLAGAILYGAAGLVLVYHALNELTAGRLGVFALIGGGLGLAAVIIAAIYLRRCLAELGTPPHR